MPKNYSPDEYIALRKDVVRMLGDDIREMALALTLVAEALHNGVEFIGTEQVVGLVCNRLYVICEGITPEKLVTPACNEHVQVVRRELKHA